MINIYMSKGKELLNIKEIKEGCWINLVNPEESEIDYISNELKLDSDFIRSALDSEERSRIEIDTDTGDTLIIVDMPFAEFEKGSRMYNTLPLGIIFTNTCIITISLVECLTIKNFIDGNVKTFFTYKKSRFILQILYKNADLFLQYLKQIDKHTEVAKLEIHKSMRNKEIIQLLDIETSLVYFSTSLKGNELVMEKLLRYDFIKKYPEDRELLEDTIIENKQAIEMAKIYSDVLNGTMDAFASIISNNLNIVMKFLTSVTIIMSIPNMVFGFFGMNVYIPFNENPFYILFIIIGVVFSCGVLVAIMVKRKMF